MMNRVMCAAIAATGIFAFGCGGQVDPPTIDSVTASSATLDEGGSITLDLTAAGEGLKFAWTSDSGTFDDATAEDPGWTADIISTTSHTPADETVTLTVTVSNDGGEVSDTVDVTVTNVNEVPTIDTAAATSDANPLPGATIDLTVSASDSEGDGLSYAWTQMTPATPAGTFTNEDTNAASWTAPAVDADTAFTFQVTITDTETGETLDTAQSTVLVPSWSMDVFPIVSQTMFDGVNAGGCDAGGGCHATGSGTFTWDHTSATTAYNAIVNVAASGNCAGMDYIEPGDPATSGIFQKISLNAGNCNGNQMPNNQNDYFNTNPGERTLIESWILAGANND